MRRFATLQTVAILMLFGTAAVAADLPVKAPPLPPLPAWSWTGFYGGLNVGYAIANVPVTESSYSAAFPNFLNNAARLPVSGVIGGGQIGYNWQIAASWLFGVEADFQGSGQRGAATFVEQAVVAAADTIGVRNNWMSSMRIRLGYVQDNANVWYLTGGYAYSRNELSLSSVNGGLGPLSIPTAGTITDNHSGWILGGGLESHLVGHWTGKVEYLYADMGAISGTSQSFTAAGVLSAGITGSEHFHDNIMRVGLNYKL
jgi:outer membrane immunogenic protein